MSILNTSLSGMLANNNWLTTISQNVANANTTGYKNVETQFSALVDSGVNFDSEFSGVATARARSTISRDRLPKPTRARISPSRVPAISSSPTPAATSI